MLLQKSVLVIASLLFFSGAAAERLPALFEHPEANLLERIEFPELRSDSKARLHCFSQIQRDGRMKVTGCYRNNAGDEVYIAAIVKAAKKARLKPARIEGKTAVVFVQFLVDFAKAGDDESIRILNNPGLQENIDAYGDDHIAAQRELTRETWQKQCPRSTRFAVWARAHVADDGQQSSFSIVPGDGPPITDKCRQGIISTLEASRFTPALADGVPVPSSFIEPFGN